MKYEVSPENLGKFKEASGWLNITGDCGFFCVCAKYSDKPEKSGFFSYGDFAEIRDGVLYGEHGEKSFCNGEITGKQIKAKLYWWAERIRRWHVATFPDATEADQIKKLCEEALEFKEVKIYSEKLNSDLEKSLGRFYEEKADCFIAAVALALRFDNEIGAAIFETFAWGDNGRLLDAVIKKMQENFRRTDANEWQKDENGIYRHKQVDKKE